MIDNSFYKNHVQRIGDQSLPAILFIPAFGDTSEVYTPLTETDLLNHYCLVLAELPGFGGAPPLNKPTTLENLASVVHSISNKEDAYIIVAHSVASIIASLAARQTSSVIDTIISLEGNLTPEDAYHSGTAADFNDAKEFHTAFLERLKKLAVEDPALIRFRAAVATANTKALWELGCDAHDFSSKHSPGKVLCQVNNVFYFYNPDNCPQATLGWLENNSINRVQLDGVSHWMSFHQPYLVAEKIVKVLSGIPRKNGCELNQGRV